MSLAAVILFSGSFATCVNADDTTYYFLRHAEINKKVPDKPLVDKGKKRAQALVGHFNGTTITQVYATHNNRTYNTVAPLAKARGLTVMQIPKQGSTIKGKTVTNLSKGKVAIKPMIKALQNVPAGTGAVIAANSGNLFAIMSGIGVPVVGEKVCSIDPGACLPCKSKKCFPKKEFNNIWAVTKSADGKVSLHRAKYGN